MSSLLLQVTKAEIAGTCENSLLAQLNPNITSTNADAAMLYSDIVTMVPVIGRNLGRYCFQRARTIIQFETIVFRKLALLNRKACLRV